MVVVKNGSRLPIGYNELLVVRRARSDSTCDVCHRTIRVGGWMAQEVVTESGWTGRVRTIKRTMCQQCGGRHYNLRFQDES